MKLEVWNRAGLPNFIDVAGMTKEYLELIYNEVKEKNQGMNMWKGHEKPRLGRSGRNP